MFLITAHFKYTLDFCYKLTLFQNYISTDAMLKKMENTTLW